MSFHLPYYGHFDRVLVLGAARSGLAAARLIVTRGGRVLLSDRASAEQLPLAAQLAAERPQVELALGGHPPALAERADLAVVSPGIPLGIEVLQAMREAGKPVIGEVELAAPFLTARTVGITGSNGKSTTTALVAEIGRCAGLATEPIGNFGRPVSDFAATAAELLAIELSSFQLEAIQHYRPDVAIYLNLTPDHMDRYADLEAYHQAKARIGMAQRAADAIVLNADDARVRTTASRARRWHFARHPIEGPGAFVHDGQIITRDDAGRETELLTATALRIRGAHNLENALAASAAAAALGLPAPAIAAALREFRGLPHRCEAVGRIAGVRVVNDSKGTNVDATLKSLGAFADERLWIILGGRDKAGDFAPLAAALAAHRPAATALLIGEAATKIGHALSESAVETISAGTLADALDAALARARSGDVVLLSPACASFDQFRNFEHRGDELRRLARERGAVSEEN